MRYLLSAATLAALAIVASCGDKTSTGGAVAKSFLPLVPPDTKVLADLHLDKLKATALYQRHQQYLNLPFLQDSTDRIGLDPRRDISELLIAWNGKAAFSLVRGSFDSSLVSQKLLALHAPQTTYQSHQVFGDPKNSVVFLSKGLSVVGDTADVEKAIDSVASTTNSIPGPLETRLQQIPPADQIWIVSNGLPFVDTPMRSDFQSALSNVTNYITGSSVGVLVDSGAHFKIDLTCISEEGAKRVHDALRGAIGFGRLSTRDDQRALMQIYDAIGVDQDGSLIHVHADYSGTLTDKLLEQFEGVARVFPKATNR